MKNELNFIPLQRVVDILNEGPITTAALAARLGCGEPKAADLLNRAILLRASEPVKKKEDLK